LEPGLYRVSTPHLCAGFEVGDDGEVVACAPILRKRIRYWATVAGRVDGGESDGG
jgi:hypothetical protein